MQLLPQDQIPPDLQRRLGQLSQLETHQQGKLMHRMVTEQTQIKKDLEQLRQDRILFTTSWEAYVTKLLEMWKKQGTERLEALAAFEERETELAVKLASVTKQLAVTAAAEKEHTSKDQQVVDLEHSETEMEAAEAEVDEASTIETEVRSRYQQAREKFKTQHGQIQNLLSEAQQEAEAAAKRDGSRTPRRRTKDTDAAAAKDKPDGTKAEQPDAALSSQPPPGGARAVASGAVTGR